MYIYELHQHTAGVSACAYDTPADTVRGLKAAGYAGMVLTNHFYHGNTGVHRQMPWVDFVLPYIAAYEEAKQVGEELDFDVLFGIEEGVGGGKEVLLYGITPDFLLAHPELRDAGLPELAALTRAAGGLVIQAHPFRIADYIRAPWESLPLEHLDGMEVHNACNDEMANMRAMQLAEKHDLILTAGSDAHTAKTRYHAGILCEHRIRTNEALVATLRSGDYELFIP